MAVDESEIDLHHNEHFDRLIDHYEEFPKNDLSWIPKERFDMAKISETFTPHLSLKTYGGDLGYLMNIYLTEWIMKNNPIMSDRSLEWKYDESSSLIPVAIALKVNGSELLPILSHFLLLRSIYNKLSYWRGQSDRRSIDYALKSEGIQLCNLPPKWYLNLTSLFLGSTIVDYIIKEEIPVAPPKNTPPTPIEKASCLKAVIEDCILSKSSQCELIRTIKATLTNGLPSTGMMVFHPLALKGLSLWLAQGTLANEYSEFLCLLREWEKGNHQERIDNSVLLEEVIPKDMQGIGERISESLRHSTVDTTVDAIAKRMGPRVKPSSEFTQAVHQRPLSIFKLHKLPSSGTIQYFDIGGRSECEGVFPDTKLEFEMSSINHLFKDPLVITTAPYKLVSSDLRLTSYIPVFWCGVSILVTFYSISSIDQLHRDCHCYASQILAP